MNSKAQKILVLLSFLLLSSTSFASGNGMKAKMQGDCSNYSIDVSKELLILKSKEVLVDSENTKTFKFPNRLDKRIQLKLTPKNKMKFSLTPEKVFHSGEKSYAGLLSFKVSKSGTYRISGDGKFWFDLIDSNKGISVKSESFSMQTKCSGIFKVVSFSLKEKSSYILQVSSSLREKVQLMITKTK
jgi:hypothetical protein